MNDQKREGGGVTWDTKAEVIPVTLSSQYAQIKKDLIEEEKHEKRRRGGEGGSMADDLMNTALTRNDFFALQAAAKEVTEFDQICQQAKEISIWFFVLLVLVIFFFVVALLVWVAVRTIEQSRSFLPRVCDHYKYIQGCFWDLPSGGLLLEWGGLKKKSCSSSSSSSSSSSCSNSSSSSDEDDEDESDCCQPDICWEDKADCWKPPSSSCGKRTLLFLHGNTENLDIYAHALHALSKLGYRVFALEYAGYGASRPGDVYNWMAPNARTLEKDLMEAWEICGSRDAIIMGFSLGGGLLGVSYPYLCPAPAQIVFLNSFDSFPRLVEESLTPCLAKLTRQFLATDWKTQSCEDYCGRVLIVVTKDDKLVPYHHGLAIANQFDCKQVVTVKLKRGGHVKAILRHRKCWTPYLLPP